MANDNDIQRRRNKGRRSRGRKKSDINKVLIFIVIIAAVLGGLAAGIYFLSLTNQTKEMKDALDTNVIYNNVFVDGTNVGGLTREQAKAELERTALDNLVTRTVTLSGENGQNFKYTYGDFGAGYDFDKSVEEAFAYGRSGSINERYAQLIALDDQPHYITSEYVFSEEKIYEIVKSLEDEVYVAPVAPSEDNPTGKIGKKLNIEITCDAVKELLTYKSDGQRDSAVFMAVETIEPNSAD